MNPVSEQLPQHLQFADNQSEVIVQKVEDKSMRCVVFVGDLITLAEKQSPLRRLGGKLFPDKKCVPNGVVTQCAITPLEEGMLSVSMTLVNPDERKNYLQSYTKTNVWNPATLQRENVEIGRSGMSAGLLFKRIYPSQEIGRIAYLNDGVTEVPGITDVRQIVEAQMFFFPDWARVAAGHSVLPTVLRRLKEHIQERMETTRHPVLLEIGDAYLRSCDQFRLWGKEYVDAQTAAIKDAEKKPGVSQRYDEIAERLFECLELTREDGLIKNFAIAQNQQAEQNQEFKTVVTWMAQQLANSQGINIGSTQTQNPAPAPNALERVQTAEEMAAALQQSQITGEENAGANDNDGNVDSGGNNGANDGNSLNNNDNPNGDGTGGPPRRTRPKATENS